MNTQEIKDALSRGGQGTMLGAVASWQNRETSISPADWEAAAIKFNLPKEFWPDRPSSEQAFSRSVLSSCSGTGGEFMAKVESKYDRTDIKVAIVWKKVLYSTDSQWDEVDRVELDLSNETVRQIGSHPVAAKIPNSYAGHRRNIEAAEVRAAVDKTMKAAGAVALSSFADNAKETKGGGSSRFVPAGGIDLAGRISDVMKELKRPFVLLEIYDSPRNSKETAEMVQSDLWTDVNRAEKKLAQIQQQFEDSIRGVDSAPQERSLKHQLAQYKEIAERATLLSDMLAIRKDDLLDKLKRLSKTVQRMMGTDDLDDDEMEL